MKHEILNANKDANADVNANASESPSNPLDDILFALNETPNQVLVASASSSTQFSDALIKVLNILFPVGVTKEAITKLFPHEDNKEAIAALQKTGMRIFSKYDKNHVKEFEQELLKPNNVWRGSPIFVKTNADRAVNFAKGNFLFALVTTQTHMNTFMRDYSIAIPVSKSATQVITTRPPDAPPVIMFYYVDGVVMATYPGVANFWSLQYTTNWNCVTDTSIFNKLLDIKYGSNADVPDAALIGTVSDRITGKTSEAVPAL